MIMNKAFTYLTCHGKDVTIMVARTTRFPYKTFSGTPITTMSEPSSEVARSGVKHGSHVVVLLWVHRK